MTLTVRTVKAGLSYRVTGLGKSSLLLSRDPDGEWVVAYTPTARVGMYHIDRFGGELSPASIRNLFGGNQP